MRILRMVAGLSLRGGADPPLDVSVWRSLGNTELERAPLGRPTTRMYLLAVLGTSWDQEELESDVT